LQRDYFTYFLAVMNFKSAFPLAALAVSVSVCIQSCSTGVRHEQYLQELVAIDKPAYPLSEVVAMFNNLESTINQRQADNGSAPDSAYADSMRLCGEKVQAFFDKSIADLEKVTEYDTALKMKQKIVTYFTNARENYALLVKKDMAICQVGRDRAEHTLLKSEWDLTGRLVGSMMDLDDFRKAFIAFQKKHGLKKTEIIRYEAQVNGIVK
jgi:hypothetical protein